MCWWASHFSRCADGKVNLLTHCASRCADGKVNLLTHCAGRCADGKVNLLTHCARRCADGKANLLTHCASRCADGKTNLLTHCASRCADGMTNLLTHCASRKWASSAPLVDIPAMYCLPYTPWCPPVSATGLAWGEPTPASQTPTHNDTCITDTNKQWQLYHRHQHTVTPVS